MIITCENCSTSFNLDEKLLKPSGSKVRCSKCKHVFTAFPAAAPEEKEAPPVEPPVEESAPMAGVVPAPDMDQETDAASAEDGVQEEADVGEDQPEDLDFDMGISPEEAPVETVEEADADELDLTGMGATLDMDAPPVEDAAVETEAVAEDLDLDMDAEPEVAEVEAEGLDLSALDEELDLESEPSGLDEVSEDLDLDLDMDAEPEVSQDAMEEELDLSVLDEELDLESEPPMDADADAEEVAEDLGLDLDMDAELEAVQEAESEELDLSSLDEALDMESEPVEEVAAESEDDVGGDLLDDLDLDLDMDVEPEVAQEAEEEELDLSVLDEELDLETEPPVDTEAGAAEVAEDLDLDLDLDAEPEAVQEAESEELDLSSLDEVLDMDPEPVEDAAEEIEDAVGDDLLKDLDLGFDMEAEPEADKEGDELDMEDIKFELGDDEDVDAPAGDEELELDLEMEPAADESGKDEDDLDLAGFEETLEMDSPPDAEAVADADDLDLELELEMEGDSKAEAEPEGVDAPIKDVDEEIEDLDFELDMEFESDDDLEGAELELESDGTEDLDMSDIEQMLEVKDGEIPGADLDAGPEVEKWKDTPGEKGPGEEPEELDLSDIDLDAEGAEDIEVEDQELDLDLDEETIKSAEAIAAGGKPIDEPEELDISQFEDLEVEEKAATGVISDGDIELEFEVDGDGTDGIGGEVTSDVVEPTQQLDTIAMDAPPVMAPDGGEAAAKKPKEKKAKKEKKKKTKKTRPVGKSSSAKPVLAILLLLLIAFGAVVVLDKYVGIEIPYVTEYVRQVPYVNQLMNQEVKKSGEITTSNINSRFVDNEKSGRLFVITGMVKNEFSESRRFIQLTGRLFASGKELVKEEMIYCGNILSDVQLTMMDLSDISNKLSNRFGDNKSNVNVEPGQQLPFMVVFSDFPQDLEEFTIEVLGSSPVQQ